MELTEQVVLVTGASRGLGRAIATAFRREGARVVVNYAKNREMAEDLVKELGKERAIAIKGDVRVKADMDALFKEAKEQFGHSITTVVNNALIDFSFNGDARDTIDDIEWSAFNKQFEGSVKAALNTYQCAKDAMKENGFGRIINIGTNLVQHPVVPYHDYNTSKAALISMTRNMAFEVGKDGINVNMVSGGLLYKTDASAATPDAVFTMIEQNTPLQKVTTPEDVADAVLFFASPWSRGITGQNLIVDGGLVMK
ncbi:3-oxoacyl-ACP reductase [Planococcaceae bacterium Storch 2/2-2]|nr:3-oxoacyl-ACP reductase [Planococcaceae bacterium Storch 2/2-2]